MCYLTIKGAGESWKQAKNELVIEVNGLRSFGIRYVGISEDKTNFLLVYEDNGKLKSVPLKFYTKGIDFPLLPCMKYMEARILYIDQVSTIVLEQL